MRLCSQRVDPLSYLYKYYVTVRERDREGDETDCCGADRFSREFQGTNRPNETGVYQHSL